MWYLSVLCVFLVWYAFLGFWCGWYCVDHGWPLPVERDLARWDPRSVYWLCTLPADDSPVIEAPDTSLIFVVIVPWGCMQVFSLIKGLSRDDLSPISKFLARWGPGTWSDTFIQVEYTLTIEAPDISILRLHMCDWARVSMIIRRGLKPCIRGFELCAYYIYSSYMLVVLEHMLDSGCVTWVLHVSFLNLSILLYFILE